MKADLRDFAIRDLGCVVCRLRDLAPRVAEKHHLLTTGRHGNGKRRGEKATVGLCAWHHRGVPDPGCQERDMVAIAGPSYQLHAAQFRVQYPDDLLLQEQNERIEQWLRNTVGR
jgi:hypothetical protein